MIFAVITHVNHIEQDQQILAYGPYVREMNIWFKYVDKVYVVAPKSKFNKTNIDQAYKHKAIVFNHIPKIEFTSFTTIVKSLIKIPSIFLAIYRVCKKSDHIHLRCPGNIGLLGCIVQLFFPSKPKSAKYAGNWDPKAKQPWSYKLQRWILSNTAITKNMSVLVYGDWKQKSKNIVPFFTATFSDIEKPSWSKRDFKKTINFLFIGGLVGGKRPQLAVQIIEELAKDQMVQLDMYGDGPLKKELKTYVQNHNLEDTVNIHGTKNLEELKSVYANSHFVILASKSEGWPKSLAEAMFFGVIPIATKVSCVPFMLNYGERGLLIEPNVIKASNEIKKAIRQSDLLTLSKNAQDWSQQYTLDYFETEIKKLLVI